MGAISLLLPYVFIAYLLTSTASPTLPVNQAPGDPISLTTTYANASNTKGRELCTSSLMWAGSTGYDAEFSTDCYQAWRKFLQKDVLEYKEENFEFLLQGASPSYPEIPKMATPRRYIKGELSLQIVYQVTALM